MANPAEKWVRIQEAGASPTGKTLTWDVINRRSNEPIGVIKWYGANGFRGYCFYPNIEGVDWILFSADCMRLIADFIDEQMRNRKATHGRRSE